jgi:hypothetical protein
MISASRVNRRPRVRSLDRSRRPGDLGIPQKRSSGRSLLISRAHVNWTENAHFAGVEVQTPPKSAWGKRGGDLPQGRFWTSCQTAGGMGCSRQQSVNPSRLIRLISARSDAVARRVTPDPEGPFCPMKVGTARGIVTTDYQPLELRPNGASRALSDKDNSNEKKK